MLKRIIRLLIFAVVAFFVIGGGVLYFQANRERITTTTASAQAVIDMLVVERADLVVSINATGALTPETQLPLLFEGSGRVAEVLFAEGDTVQAGDVIARLDTSDLDAALAEAEIVMQLQQIAYDALTAPPREADLAVAEAAVNAARASLSASYSSANPNAEELAALQSEIARNQLWQAQLQRDIAAGQTSFTPSIAGFIPDGVEVPQEVIDQIEGRLSGLFPSTTVDPDQFTAGLTQAQYGVEIADANAAAADESPDAGSVAGANAALVSAQVALDRLTNGADDLDLQAAQLGLLQAQNAVEQARTTRARFVLTAPFDGVIAQNNLKAGEMPPQQAVAVLLVDTSGLYVDLSVDETDVVDLVAGQLVVVRFDALPDSEISGQVAEIAITPIRAAGLVTYAVRVRLDPSDQPLRIGLSATATITVEELLAVIVVPNRFIRIDRTSGDAFVTVERSIGRYEEVAIQLGLRNAIESEISAGLAVGDRLVLLPRGTFDVFN